jgi:hypothetical protein
MTEIVLDASLVKRPKTADSILDTLEDIDDSYDSSPSLPSLHRPVKEKKKKSEVDELSEISQESTDEWLDTVASFKREPIKCSKHSSSGLFDYLETGDKKKKKKKKNKDKEGIDYKKEFEPEINFLQNTLEEQTRFANNLQRRYDSLENSKSAARGVGKFTTDLISQINQARGTSVQLVNSIISTKKTIADLQMKERKEFGAQVDTGEDMGLYSANFLKKVLSQSRSDLAAYGGDVTPMDGDADDIFKNLSDDLEQSGEDRPEEVEKYMKYGTNVEIIAEVDNETNEYELVAVDKTTGEKIDDYPSPVVAKLEVNRSTGMASDEYYNKYRVKWV